MSENQKKIHHIPPGKWHLESTHTLREKILLEHGFEKPKYTFSPEGDVSYINGGTHVNFFKDRLFLVSPDGSFTLMDYNECFFKLSYGDICMCVEYYRDHCISNSAGFPPGTEYIFMPKKSTTTEAAQN